MKKLRSIMQRENKNGVVEYGVLSEVWVPS